MAPGGESLQLQGEPAWLQDETPRLQDENVGPSSSMSVKKQYREDRVFLLETKFFSCSAVSQTLFISLLLRCLAVPLPLSGAALPHCATVSLLSASLSCCPLPHCPTVSLSPPRCFTAPCPIVPLSRHHWLNASLPGCPTA
jgi:hypothetical protein